MNSHDVNFGEQNTTKDASNRFLNGSLMSFIRQFQNPPQNVTPNEQVEKLLQNKFDLSELILENLEGYDLCKARYLDYKVLTDDLYSRQVADLYSPRTGNDHSYTYPPELASTDHPNMVRSVINSDFHTQKSQSPKPDFEISDVYLYFGIPTLTSVSSKPPKIVAVKLQRLISKYPDYNFLCDKSHWDPNHRALRRQSHYQEN